MPQKTTSASLQGKTCVITGATSGVGNRAAYRIAKAGADIVMISRNRQKAEAVRDKLGAVSDSEIRIIIADFTDLSQVKRAARQTLDTCPKIDILINCAGIHMTKRILTPAGIETAFCVNHLASFLLTRLLLQRIIESAPSRIIQVNSEGHRFGGLDLDDINWRRRFYFGLRGYGASKTAQLLTVWEFADHLQQSGVTINAVHPGDVRTNIGNNNGRIYRWFLHNVTWRLLKDAEISGDALYYHAAAPELSGISGKFYNLTIEENPAPHALDRELGKTVFKLSEKMTGAETMW